MKYRLLKETTVHSAAISTSPIVTELQPGDEINVGQIITNGTERWHNVALLDGKTGYISAKTKGSRIWGPLDICYAVCAGAFVWVPAQFFAFYYIAVKMGFAKSISDRFLLTYLVVNAVILLVCAFLSALSRRRWSWIFVILNILVVIPDAWYWLLVSAFSGGIYK
jgi:hypothetical protein